MPIHAERGYLITALNPVDWTGAAALARTLRSWHPDVNIAVMTSHDCTDSVFDHVVGLPHSTDNCHNQDWQCVDATPYRQTIKLQANTVLAGPIDHWWTLLQNKDVVISQSTHNIYGQPVSSHTRPVFVQNHLPDVYSAITYWRLSRHAQQFFSLVRDIDAHWDQYRLCLPRPPIDNTADMVYAMAAVIMGAEQVTLPPHVGPVLTTVNLADVQLQTHDWTCELTWELCHPGLRINTAAQWGLVDIDKKNWRLCV